MKKTPFFLAAVLSAALISGNLYAQNSIAQKDLAGTQPVHATDLDTASSNASPAHDAAVSSINVRAIKDFKGRFNKATDERWCRLEKGFCASFIQDGLKVRAYYDTRGHWQASLTYCDEFQLPHFIRDIVKRTWYDLAITVVNIVEVPEHKAYLVHLEDKYTLKIVRVSEDGEMDVLNDYIKTI